MRAYSLILTFTRALNHIEADELCNRSPTRSRQMLGDQEPCTADRGCRIVTVEIVVLLSTFYERVGLEF